MSPKKSSADAVERPPLSKWRIGCLAVLGLVVLAGTGLLIVVLGGASHAPPGP